MPTYEYICSSCGHEWEQEQRIVDNPLDTCPTCNQKTAKRQISAGNFILKGGGWYADLYSSAKKGTSNASAGSSSKAATTRTTSNDSTSSSIHRSGGKKTENSTSASSSSS